MKDDLRAASGWSSRIRPTRATCLSKFPGRFIRRSSGPETCWRERSKYGAHDVVGGHLDEEALAYLSGMQVEQSEAPRPGTSERNTKSSGSPPGASMSRP